MKKTLLSIAALVACAAAQAAPVAVIAARPAPAVVRAPTPAPVAARPAPAPAPVAAKPVAREAAPHVTTAPAVNPALLATTAGGSKKSCDDRAAAKGDCKR